MSDDGLVVVGASLAGAKAAEEARSQGWTGRIRLAEAEPAPAAVSFPADPDPGTDTLILRDN